MCAQTHYPASVQTVNKPIPKQPCKLNIHRDYTTQYQRMDVHIIVMYTQTNKLDSLILPSGGLIYKTA